MQNMLTNQKQKKKGGDPYKTCDPYRTSRFFTQYLNKSFNYFNYVDVNSDTLKEKHIRVLVQENIPHPHKLAVNLNLHNSRSCCRRTSPCYPKLNNAVWQSTIDLHPFPFWVNAVYFCFVLHFQATVLLTDRRHNYKHRMEKLTVSERSEMSLDDQVMQTWPLSYIHKIWSRQDK